MVTFEIYFKSRKEMIPSWSRWGEMRKKDQG